MLGECAAHALVCQGVASQAVRAWPAAWSRQLQARQSNGGGGPEQPSALLPAPPSAGGSQSRRVASVVAAGGPVRAAIIPYPAAKAYLSRHPLVRGREGNGACAAEPV